MKRRIVSILAGLALTAGLFPAAQAAAPTLVVAMKIGSPWCVIGDTVTQVDEKSEAVTPVLEQVEGGARTLLPIRRVLEAFGGKVDWLAPNGVTCSLNGVEVALNVGEDFATVNGARVDLDVPAKAMNNRTFVPVRFVTENLGLTVDYEGTVVVVADGALDRNSLSQLPQVKTLVEKTTPPPGDPTALKSGSYALPSGTVNANVITVDMTNPRVSVKTAIPGNLLNYTQSFGTIASGSGAVAVINANFFNSYDAVKDPVGHVMADGNYLYASSGGSTLGITADNEMRWGHPAVFVHVRTADDGAAQLWDVFEINVLKQFANQAVLYTPARGAAFPVTYPGYVLVAENNISTAYRAVAPGESVSIPANGFVAYFSQETASTAWHVTPELGRTLELEPYLFTQDDEGFSLEGVKNMVGGLRLVKDGAIFDQLEGDFAYDSRFKGSYAAPRTAVGSTADQKLLLVEVGSATIQQMRELMSVLGCVDAVNLDGGASTGMYYKGQTLATPGRELTVTLQVFVSD